jgi:hypothetical protein
MPSRLLTALAAGVALTWALACSRAAPAPHAVTPEPQPVLAVVVPGGGAASPPSHGVTAAASAPVEPRASADEIAAIEHPRVAK